MGPFLIVTGDFVATGGMDRANHALAFYLARNRHEVHLVAHRAAEDLRSFSNVVFHPVPKPAGSYFLAGPVLDQVGRYWARQVSARGGRVIVNGGNCPWGDVNWVHYVHAAYAPQVATSLPRRLKSALSHRAFLVAERKALHEARIVIANSRRTSRDVIEKVGVPAERVRVVYYGTDPRSYRPATPVERAAKRAKLGWPAGRPVVAFVGALADRRKGFDILFAAWTELCNDLAWDPVLAVIGAGAELNAWRARASAAGLADHIRFLGFRADVPELLAACDALVSPARYEAYGLGVHEALCCGLPVLVSADAGVAERLMQLDGDWSASLLAGPSGGAGVAQLCAALRRWRSAPQRYASLALRASDQLRSVTWHDMAEEFTLATGVAGISTHDPAGADLLRPV